MAREKAPPTIDQKQFDALTTAMGKLCGSTNVQVMALFVATWAALRFEEQTIRVVLDKSDELVGNCLDEVVGQNIIDRLRTEILPGAGATH